MKKLPNKLVEATAISRQIELESCAPPPHLLRSANKMSQQSEMADSVYIRLSEGPVATAHLVRELRERWGVEHGISAVHGFICEVATCLLWNGDVDVGDFRNGGFVSWALEPEDANERIDEELMSMDAFLKDENRQVFRKKKNHGAEPAATDNAV